MRFARGGSFETGYVISWLFGVLGLIFIAFASPSEGLKACTRCAESVIGVTLP